ncbi:uncharacterized protein LOC119670937 [Teleopsis dalmanni]|uniref:uncharacterized protein LOC119670937 n=1 Tax=Teleopsis dalmanni TaxID=139649 RepID=UPI0018CC7FF6|nr:uncharacterized protein LOC119670937 [Teleopsis dalmanni]
MIKALQHKIGCVFMTSPSLAITFNNILFKNKDMREASVYDIQRLNYSFTTKYISHLVIMNGTTNNIKCVMDFVKTYGFKYLKYLYMTVMSHGNKGGIIYTETDVYNIEDVIFKALRENITLRNLLLINLINICRGVIDPRFEDRDLVYEEIDNDDLDENFISFYSAQEGYVSYLKEYGAAFIMAFCDNFNTITTERSMLAIAQSVENTLQNKMQFSPKVTEYRAKPGVTHIIKMELANSSLYTELYGEIYDIVQNRLFAMDNTVCQNVTACI